MHFVSVVFGPDVEDGTAAHRLAQSRATGHRVDRELRASCPRSRNLAVQWLVEILWLKEARDTPVGLVVDEDGAQQALARPPSCTGPPAAAVHSPRSLGAPAGGPSPPRVDGYFLLVRAQLASRFVEAVRGMRTCRR